MNIISKSLKSVADAYIAMLQPVKEENSSASTAETKPEDTTVPEKKPEEKDEVVASKEQEETKEIEATRPHWVPDSVKLEQTDEFLSAVKEARQNQKDEFEWNGNKFLIKEKDLIQNPPVKESTELSEEFHISSAEHNELQKAHAIIADYHDRRADYSVKDKSDYDFHKKKAKHHEVMSKYHEKALGLGESVKESAELTERSKHFDIFGENDKPTKAVDHSSQANDISSKANSVEGKSLMHSFAAEAHHKAAAHLRKTMNSLDHGTAAYDEAKKKSEYHTKQAHYHEDK